MSSGKRNAVNLPKQILVRLNRRTSTWDTSHHVTVLVYHRGNLRELGHGTKLFQKDCSDTYPRIQQRSFPATYALDQG